MVSLRAEIEQEIAELIPVAIQQPLTLRIDDLLGMTKVQVIALKRDYEHRTMQTYSTAVELAATTRFLHAVEVRMDDLDRVNDVLSRESLQQLHLNAVNDQHRASGLKEIPA